MIEVKWFSPEPLEEILDAALRIYPNAKFQRGDPDDQKRLIQMCIRNGDLSIFSHASAKIEITCSLLAAHQLQLVDNDITVKTYVPVNGNGLTFITPKEFIDDDKLKSIFSKFLKQIRLSIKELSKSNEVDYRYILPGCVQTQVLISTSFLGFLRILKLINYRQTSQELIEICELIYSELNTICSPVFNKMNLKFKI